MGMFDYIECRRVMPDGFDGNTHTFQTKDFDCDMVTYVITAEGRLLQPIWLDDTNPLFASRPHDKMHDKHYHGFVNFYTYLSERETLGESEWHGYYAKFTEGQLVEIMCDDQTLARMDVSVKSPDEAKAK